MSATILTQPSRPAVPALALASPISSVERRAPFVLPSRKPANWSQELSDWSAVSSARPSGRRSSLIRPQAGCRDGPGPPGRR